MAQWLSDTRRLGPHLGWLTYRSGAGASLAGRYMGRAVNARFSVFGGLCFSPTRRTSGTPA